MSFTFRPRLGAAGVLAGLAGAGTAFIFDALVREPRTIRIARIEVPVEWRFRAVHRLRIAQLSDLHVGGQGWVRGTAEKAILACNRADVDLVAITGDFVGNPNSVRVVLRLLEDLRQDVPRLAVFGNHDHIEGETYFSALLRGLEELGITVLTNTAQPLHLPAGRVWFVGVDDGYSARDDLPRALAATEDDGAPRVLLTHYPEVAESARPGEIQLALAGYSHAGQIRLPILASKVHNGHARTKYSHGLYVVNGNPLYVSAGLGMSGIPMRFRNPPEMAILSFAALKPSGFTAANETAASTAAVGSPR